MSETERESYHHGDLKSALLEAAEIELARTGPVGFSLRACARRAGVSHAAPKHHFGGAEGLLDALAARGFRRLVDGMERAMAGAKARERLVRSGCGYVMFARGDPALFKLMFARARSAAPSRELEAAAAAAFEILRANALLASPGRPAPQAALDIAASWALVHGLAHLLIEDSPAIGALLGEGDLEAVVERVLITPLPVSGPSPG